MDNWAIAAGAQHPEAAHAFIDFLLTPENQLTNVAYIGYHTGAKDIETGGPTAPTCRCSTWSSSLPSSSTR